MAVSQRNYPDLIAAYLDFTKHQESSSRIHLWSALSMLATTMERRLYMDRGYYHLYPNLYVFIVGPSGIIKKSTSTGLAVSFLKQLPDLKMMADRVTASSLIEQLATARKKILVGSEEIEHSSMFIYASELIVFVKEVFGSVTELLTTFWDCPNQWIYKTKHHGQNNIKGVCLNMLAATTIQWLHEGVTSQIMSAGFAGRVIFVCEKKGPKKWVAWPTTPTDHETTRHKILEDLNHIYQLQGSMIPTDATQKRFTEWYEYHMENVARSNEDPRISGYYGRKGEMLLKVAMIRSISLGDSLRVEPEHLEWAIEKMDDIEKDLGDIYTTEQTDEVEKKFKVLDYIQAEQKRTGYKHIVESHIFYYFSKDRMPAATRYLLDSLVMEGRLLRDGGGVPSKTYYRINQAISTAWD